MEYYSNGILIVYHGMEWGKYNGIIMGYQWDLLEYQWHVMGY